jgi:hypothetical protein
MWVEVNFILALMLFLTFTALLVFRRMNRLATAIDLHDKAAHERFEKISEQMRSVGRLEAEHFDSVIGEGRYIAQEIVLVVDALLKGEAGDKAVLPWLRTR